MDKDSFTFGGVCSADYGAIIEGVQAWNSPVRDRLFSVVPGRNGESMTDNGRFGCVNVTYRLAILQDFEAMYDALKNDLLNLTGWQRLEDTIDTEVYRMGAIAAAMEPQILRRNKTGRFSVTFRCQPQRWFKKGERTYTAKAPMAVVFDEKYRAEAHPLITVYGSGATTLTIGQTSIQINTLEDHLILDCESMDAYKMVDGTAVNCNSHIYAPKFPVLTSGSNVIAWTGDGVTQVDMVPRWWKL